MRDRYTSVDMERPFTLKFIESEAMLSSQTKESVLLKTWPIFLGKNFRIKGYYMVIIKDIKIFSSTMKRAKNTAELIGNAINTPVLAVKTLDELDYGVADGLTYPEII